MKKKKLFSRCLCLGIIWGIISWVLHSNFIVENVFSIYTFPVFLSNQIQNNLFILKSYKGIYLMSFLLSILVGGMIGYFSAFIISKLFKDQYKEGKS